MRHGPGEYASLAPATCCGEAVGVGEASVRGSSRSGGFSDAKSREWDHAFGAVLQVNPTRSVQGRAQGRHSAPPWPHDKPCGQTSERSKLFDGSSDHGLLLAPRPPDSLGPLVRAVGVFGPIARVDEVKDRQLSGTRVTTKNREVVAPVNDPPQYAGGGFRRQPQLKHRIEAGEVSEYRLAIPSVAAGTYAWTGPWISGTSAKH
jgi:hypothetical protein